MPNYFTQEELERMMGLFKVAERSCGIRNFGEACSYVYQMMGLGYLMANTVFRQWAAINISQDVYRRSKQSSRRRKTHDDGDYEMGPTDDELLTIEREFF